MAIIDSQPSQSHARDATRQLLAPGVRQTTVFEFGEGQRVVTPDAVGRILADGDKGFRQPLFLMLAGDLP